MVLGRACDVSRGRHRKLALEVDPFGRAFDAKTRSVFSMGCRAVCCKLCTELRDEKSSAAVGVALCIRNRFLSCHQPSDCEKIVLFSPLDLCHRPSDSADLPCKSRLLKKAFCSHFEGLWRGGRVVCPEAGPCGPHSSSSFSLFLLCLALSGSKVYEPQVRAHLGTASQFCESVVFKLKMSIQRATAPFSACF